MAAVTQRGITYTPSAGHVHMMMDLPLQGGVDQDSTVWLAGAASGYPGALTAFQPRQTDGSNVFNPRLVVLKWSGSTDNATLTLSGDCSDILFTGSQWLGDTGSLDPTIMQSVATGVLVNDGSHWLTSESSVAVDTVDATTQFSIGDVITNLEGHHLGTVETVAANLITTTANTPLQSNDNTELYKRTPLILKNVSGGTESVVLMLLIV
tara:strand:- start:39411 stop:40037 length:627 start_codon:yes stop_codon:yes gene_type:complete